MIAYVGGDEAAFRELFERYRPLLLGILRRSGQVQHLADAQDLVQQTFLQLHRARFAYRAGSRLRPWIITIAMNLCRDHLRRASRRLEEPVAPEWLEQAPAPAAAAATAELDGLVRAALVSLPETQRAVIELHWLDQLPFHEIAPLVGASLGAVRVRAHRGYEQLRRSLEPVAAEHHVGWRSPALPA